MSDTLDHPRSPLTAKDWAADMEVRWCPGCGDYAILKAVLKTVTDLGLDPDRTAFISGIGCASRFPYYVESYGFHTIHGRAATIATGAKLARPELDVWVVSGDGDSLSIGGNHLLHLVRRNLDLVYLLFNNQIYGLTKGQASPTSRLGQVTPSTPEGSIDQPVHAGSFVLGAGATFYARVPDVAQAQLVEVMKQAHDHRGTGFVEILQNCIVYNDGAFAEVTGKATAPERQLWCKAGEPLLYAGGRKGLRFDPAAFDLVPFTVGEDGFEVSDAVVHDPTNRRLAQMLAARDDVLAMGVVFQTDAPTLDGLHHARRPAAKEDLQALLEGRETWVVA
ncbi:MAG: 2-oxoacid:ferredoxin oxidoreductase subunit beta [Geminicoccaceae bacterium]|nr:MAG: 2-oxoacid:ferredoxin oxidoreductase subunit beta [Geminicoccaceae bacterium]